MPTSVPEPRNVARGLERLFVPAPTSEPRVQGRWRRSSALAPASPARKWTKSCHTGCPVDSEPSGTTAVEDRRDVGRRQSVTCLVIGNALPAASAALGNCWKVAFSEVSSWPRSAGRDDAAELPDGAVISRRGSAARASATGRARSRAAPAAAARGRRRLSAAGATRSVWSRPETDCASEPSAAASALEVAFRPVTRSASWDAESRRASSSRRTLTRAALDVARCGAAQRARDPGDVLEHRRQLRDRCLQPAGAAVGLRLPGLRAEALR